jgi:hypothetical protein
MELLDWRGECRHSGSVRIQHSDERESNIEFCYC